ncbi:DUF3817 domain-containing protein [Kocuria marina]|uniref:DUF3817 domain-containing protein n=1 Tax=Kocuria marina TaxID=223184 RepID=UPI00298A04FB|nr:DUF3817 domain-containing protein [Kocuria marina]MCT1735632.1 DUF3817 domain-containing protein [Kocuria marina]
MSASTQQRYGLPLVARVSIVAALLEAFTWAGLLAGMFLKYVTGTTDVGVSIFGALHGGMFLIYLAIALITAITLRWPWRVTALSIIAAVPPLTTIPLEIWLRRRGHLSC